VDQDVLVLDELMTEVDLGVYETVIERGKRTFIEVGRALKEIRDRKGYRFKFSAFEQYVQERWGFSVSTGYNMISASQVIENVQPVGQIDYTKAVALSRLEPEQQRAFVEQHNVLEMSKRDIEVAIKAQREAEVRAERAERELVVTQEQSASILERDRRLREENERLKRENNPESQVVEVEKVVPPSDYDELKQTVKRQDEKLVSMSREELARTHRYQVRHAVQDLDGSVASGLSEVAQKLAPSEEDWISDPHTANSIRTCIETLESATQTLQNILSTNSGRSQTKRGVVIDGQFSDLA